MGGRSRSILELGPTMISWHTARLGGRQRPVAVGLSTILLGILMALVSGLVLLAMMFFGLLVMAIVGIRTMLAGLFGAFSGKPRPAPGRPVNAQRGAAPANSTEKGSGPTIQMRRDGEGAWHRDEGA